MNAYMCLMKVEKLKSHGDKKSPMMSANDRFLFFSVLCSILKVFFIGVRTFVYPIHRARKRKKNP
jgi:hypothetical protein